MVVMVKEQRRSMAVDAGAEGGGAVSCESGIRDSAVYRREFPEGFGGTGVRVSASDVFLEALAGLKWW